MPYDPRPHQIDPRFYLVTPIDMHPQAYHAVRAAELRPQIGPYAAQRYCINHDVPERLYILARILRSCVLAGV